MSNDNYVAALRRLREQMSIPDQVRSGFKRRENKFDPLLGLSEYQEGKVSEEITKLTSKHRMRDYKITEKGYLPRRYGAIVANAIKAFQEGTVCYYSRSKDTIKKTAGNDLIFAKMKALMRAINEMEKEGLLKTTLGTQGTINKERSTFVATPELINLIEECRFNQIQYEYHVQERPTVILRNDEGTDIRFADTDAIIAMKTLGTAYNDFMAKQNVYVLKDDGTSIRQTCFLARIFNGHFRSGGRFYQSTVQQLGNRHDDAERKRLYINGNRTVEKDYSAFQPRLLYQMLGIEFIGDIYRVEKLQALLSPYLNEAEQRCIIKLALVAMINRNTRKGFIQSIPKFEKVINKTRMQNALLSNRPDEYVEFKWSETGVDIKTVFILCEEAHSAIAHLFYKGRGMHLMFMESEICSRVIQRALNDNIVICPIHDSFIVEVQYEDWLERVMLEEYEYVTGRMTIVK